MGLTLYDVPGFRERYEAALKALFTRRDAAFCSLDTIEIAGLEFRPLTLRSIVDLCIANNRVLLQPDARNWTLDELAIFLWRLNLNYPDTRYKRKHYKALKRIKLVDLRESVGDYVRGMFEDAPKGGGDQKEIPFASYAAFLVDLFATEYGWTMAEVMDAPYESLLQLQRIISKRRDPKQKFRPPFPEMRREALSTLRTLKETGFFDHEREHHSTTRT